ncbi:MAG: hypothetical protein HDT28_08900 [Clostridiales bacterium]|nr:hypothetical protein [Clostridiales bacterium]
MARSTEQRLLQAVKTDDVREFDGLAENARIGEYRLGRFPVLSLLYLYKARKILATHELELLKISRYEKKSEPAELSRKFSGAAGKCLRLYYDEVVSPLEMLLILDKTRRLARVYKDAAKTEQIKSRLQSIYSIKYALSVKFEGENIIIDKRPLSYREKKKIFIAGVCAAVGVAVVVCVPTITVSLLSEPAAPVVYEVMRLSDIDFSSQNEYVLKRDIVLSEAVEEMNCKIGGEGHKLILGDGAAIGTLNGSLSGVTVDGARGVIFDTVSAGARVADVTVNVDADIETDENSALVAIVNYGEFDGVTVNIKGSVKAIESDDENVIETAFGGMVMNNGAIYNDKTQEADYGVIKNCTVNYLQFKLVGEASANASFGGIVGFNDGYLQDCTVTGEIVSDTFDVAGVCVVNNNELSNCVNSADIAQTASNMDWNPITCGVVLTNTYMVKGCKNTGKISAASTYGSASDDGRNAIAAGIAYYNNFYYQYTPYITNCVNSGEVESSAANGSAYAAGVCYASNGGIEFCKNSGSARAEAGNGYEALGGGIADYAYGYIYKSVNEGDVYVSGSGEAYAGGISALARAQFLYCVSSGDITVTAKTARVGGIYGVSEIDTYGKGTAEYCISENRLDVTAINGGAAYVGGIAGYVREQLFTVSGGRAFFGGGVTDSCFVGECVKPDDVYFGNIVGACGANIYESNLYYSGDVELHNFNGNYYVDNSFMAFGATFANSSGGGLVTDVSDKGATSLPTEEVKTTETYKTILSELQKN